LGTWRAYSGDARKRYELLQETTIRLASEESVTTPARSVAARAAERSKEMQDIQTLDAYAFSELICITNATPNYIVAHYEDKDDEAFKAEAAWNALCNKYEPKSTARRMELKREYTNAMMGLSTDPDDFMREQDFLRQQLKANGHAISDEEFLQDCVLKLPMRVYSELITKIETSLDAISLGEYQTMVRAFYRRRVQGVTEAGVPEAALMAQGRRFRGAQPLHHKDQTLRSGRFHGECLFCKKRGHKIADCYKLKELQRLQEEEDSSVEPATRSEVSRR